VHLKIVAIYQIIGGILGLMVAGFTVEISVLYNLIFFLFIICFFLYSILCGIVLLKNRSLGITLTVINQVLQIVGFAILGYAFKYVSGISFTILIDLSENTFFFNLGLSEWKILLMGHSDLSNVSINLIPIFIIIYTERMGNKTIEAPALDIESETGKTV
jgi:hypothetical protein